MCATELEISHLSRTGCPARMCYGARTYARWSAASGFCPVRVVIREVVRYGAAMVALLENIKIPYGSSCAQCVLRVVCAGRSVHASRVRVMCGTGVNGCDTRYLLTYVIKLMQENVHVFRSRDITVPRTRGQNWYQCSTNQWRLQAVYGQPLGAVILLRAISYSTRCYE